MRKLNRIDEVGLRCELSCFGGSEVGGGADGLGESVVTTHVGWAVKDIPEG